MTMSILLHCSSTILVSHQEWGKYNTGDDRCTLAVYTLISRNAEILVINQCMCLLCVFLLVQERMKEIVPQ